MLNAATVAERGHTVWDVSKLDAHALRFNARRDCHRRKRSVVGKQDLQNNA